AIARDMSAHSRVERKFRTLRLSDNAVNQCKPIFWPHLASSFGTHGVRCRHGGLMDGMIFSEKLVSTPDQVRGRLLRSCAEFGADCEPAHTLAAGFATLTCACSSLAAGLRRNT